MTAYFTFPDHFQWGTSTSSYQIEGAAREDGRGDSIWDIYCRKPGAVLTGETGDVACDHYHRWRDDIALMKELGYKAYRFSLAWPRIIPQGQGQVNQVGLDFYDRLIDTLLEKGITPLVTLYHWDLPAALPGGWLNRNTAFAFQEYTDIAARTFGDRVKQWVTINEPFCASFLSYAYGMHAPGAQNPAQALVSAHHLLLAHGLAIPILHASNAEAQAGIATNHSPIYPASATPADEDVARHADGELNRWFLDPLYGRGYPTDLVNDYIKMGILRSTELDFVRPGDMDLIATPTDFLGINYYSRNIVGAAPNSNNNPFQIHHQPAPADNQTAIGWEIYPDGLFEMISRLHIEYKPGPIIVAENGASYPDGPDDSGRVRDDKRIEYLEAHIKAIARAIQSGIPVEGYYIWSFLDNFEWRFGYDQRFGLVFVDFQDQTRYPKDSAFWYQKVIQYNRLEI